MARTRATLILRQALQWAIEHCDADLIGWLAGLTGEWVSQVLNVFARGNSAES